MNAISQKIIVSCLYCKSMYRVPAGFADMPVTCTKCRRTFMASEAPLKMQNPEDRDLFLCKLSLNYGFVNEKTLEAVLTEFSRIQQSGGKPGMATLLVRFGGMHEKDVDLMVDVRDNWDLRLAEKQFAREAVEKGFIDETQARGALIRQAQMFRKDRKICLLCDMLSESGELTREQCNQILKGKQPSVQTPVPKPHPPAQVEQKTREAPPPSAQPDLINAPDPKAPEPQPPEHTSAPPAPRAESPPPESEAAPPAAHPPPDTPAVEEPSAPPRTSTTSESLEAVSQEPDAVETDAVPAAAKEMPPEKEAIAQHEAAPANESTGRYDEEDKTKGPIIIPVQGLELIIDGAGLTALLKVPEGVDPTTVPVNEIKATLAQEEIVFGVVEDSLIRGFLNSKIFREKPFKLAEGKPPKPGIKGRVDFFFDTDYLKIGAISDDGNIDFKNRGEIPFVTAGTLLAEITPSFPGKNGTDIYGRDLLVQDVPEITLRCDSGTELSENGRRVFAAINGQPKLNFGNRIQVLSELVIPGDVGFETGHVEFEGNIKIKGTVQADFSVKGANITATEVVGAEITATGDLTVANGILNSVLNVQGNIQTKFMHNSRVNAYGNVISAKEIIDSSIINSGACLVQQGKIISSDIASKLGLECKEIGTEMSKPCHIRIGVDDHIAHEADQIEQEINEQKERLEALTETLSALTKEEKVTQQKITELAHVQDRSQLEQKDIQSELDKHKAAGPAEKIAELKEQIEALVQKAREADDSIGGYFDRQDELLEQINAQKISIADCRELIRSLKAQKKDKLDWAKSLQGKAALKTTGSIHAGTVVAGLYCSKTLREKVRNVKIREIRTGDAAEGWEMKIL